VLIVGTCPRCLPVGSISWLIENGRQLDIFEEPSAELRVDDVHERDDPDEIIQVTPVIVDDSLPF